MQIICYYPHNIVINYLNKMIFLSGQKATGKSTAAKLFKEEGFLVLDQGPFWKKVLEGYLPNGVDTGEFIKYMKKYTGDNQWDDSILVGLINNLYRSNKNKCKDIVIAGYRSDEGISYLRSKLDGKIFPENGIKIVLLTSEFDTALDRFRKRENVDIDRSKFIEIYNTEIARGFEGIKKMADFTIDTSKTTEDGLREILIDLIYKKLNYSKCLDKFRVREVHEGSEDAKRSFKFGELHKFDYRYELESIDQAIAFAINNLGNPTEIKQMVLNMKERDGILLSKEGINSWGPANKERF